MKMRYNVLDRGVATLSAYPPVLVYDRRLFRKSKGMAVIGGKRYERERKMCIRASAGVEKRSGARGVEIKGAEKKNTKTKPKGQFYEFLLPGFPEPMGCTHESFSGVTNFSLFASNATEVSLCLFTEDDLLKGEVTLEIPLDPEENRTGDVWHVAVQSIDADLLYAYRVSGTEYDGTCMTAGLAYAPENIVLDPYSKSIYNGRREFGELGMENGFTPESQTWPQAASALPLDDGEFDWEGDVPLEKPMEDLVIYEAHVRGFTQHENSDVEHPGTYAGLIEKLDYLKYLGINAIELMPVHEFNELEYYRVDLEGTNTPNRYNYWGYSTVGFFAPMSRYSGSISNKNQSAGEASRAAIHEFKTLVKECHKRGIEVILDVVFNHTAEGNEHGPTISFRGIDNRVYYMLAPGGEYYNYSGCGNTFNCNHPVARKFIVDCLRYWVEEMHVDGFRFDLGSIMTRAHSLWHPVNTEGSPRSDAMEKYFPGDMSGEWSETSDVESEDNVVGGLIPDGAGAPVGAPLSDPPLIASISSDPILAHTKLIAEAWDCDGLNQVGAFPHYGGRWSEWNGHFRDVTRQFIKGTDGNWAGAFAAALCGSPNIYVNEPGEHDWWGNNGGRRWKSGRGPTASINFVTAHDGFTLHDLVSYNDKHNEANGEDNRDGESHNLSWNCGEEGATERAEVQRLRERQMRNFMTALLVAHGVPMILMGDEYGHTKHGNNNTYCHDSHLNYFDWEAAKTDTFGLLRFTKHMIALRKRFSALRRNTYVSETDLRWHGKEPDAPDWSETSRFLALEIKGRNNENDIYVAFNTGHVPELVTLPHKDGHTWKMLVDTGKKAPFDILVPDERLTALDIQMAHASMEMWTSLNKYAMLPWSCILLESYPSHDNQGSSKMPDTYRKELSLGLS